MNTDVEGTLRAGSLLMILRPLQSVASALGWLTIETFCVMREIPTPSFEVIKG